MRLSITLTSDFICPWCFIGERRLDLAVAALGGEVAVDVLYRPFELNPDMPAEGIDRRVYRTAKFGSWERSLAMDARIAGVGAEDGLAFNFDRVTRTPSTQRAHRLMWLAQKAGADATPLARTLFRAYFTEGRDISDRDVLLGLATSAGLPAAEVAEMLDGDLGVTPVRRLTEDAYRRGVQGVPLFEFGGTAVSGAQPVPLLTAALRRAAAQPVPA